MRAFVTILAVLVLAVGVSADQGTLADKGHNSLSADVGSSAGVGDGTNPFIGAAANNCASLVDLGPLPAPGVYGLGGDTTGGGNDFEYDGSTHGVSACGDMAHPDDGSGPDQIWMFTVAQNSYWYFGTCRNGWSYAGYWTYPYGYYLWDSSLQITQDDGTCPGVEVACNGDGPGCEAYSSRIDDVFLATGNTYYLIVDGWAASQYGTYTLWFEQTGLACETDEDCLDTIACNGLEWCDTATGECMPGTSPCERWQYCEEPEGTCTDPDPCFSWLPCGHGGFGPALIWGAVADLRFGDDVELETHGGTRTLISYQLGHAGYTHWAGAPVGTPYHLETDLYLTEFVSCYPWIPYPDTNCGFDLAILDSGLDHYIVVCEPNGGLPSVALPDNSGNADMCEIDFWIVHYSDRFDAGMHNASCTPKMIGEAGFEDEIGQDVFARENLDSITGQPNGTWGLGAWLDAIADLGDGGVCTVPAGACAGPGRALIGCEDMTEADCISCGGTYQGDNTMADQVGCADLDPDGDNVYGTLDNCPMDFNPDQADCNDDGEGNACEPWDEQDDDGDGTCNAGDGCPDDPFKTEAGQCGCGNPDTDTDSDGTADCNDECDENPVWQVEPPCGCDSTPYDNLDDDGDGFENCFDTCAGVDDAEFGPCDDAIPTVSEWGLVILALLLLAAGKVYFGRRPEMG